MAVRIRIASSSWCLKVKNRTNPSVFHCFLHKVRPRSHVGNLVCATGATRARPRPTLWSWIQGCRSHCNGCFMFVFAVLVDVDAILLWFAGQWPGCSEPTFRPSGATTHWKNTCCATFLPFRAPASSFFWFFLFSDLLPSHFLFSDSFHLCFSICPYCRRFDFYTSFNKAILESTKRTK